MQPDNALPVEPQQVVKLGGHGVNFLLGLPVIVVVVSEGLVLIVGVLAEGPEAIEVHVAAQLQRQAGHDEARAEADGPEALRAPEAGQAHQVLGVEEDGPRGAPKVLQGVEGAQRHRRVVAVREGGEEDQGVAERAETLHEGPSPLHEPTKPDKGSVHKED